MLIKEEIKDLNGKELLIRNATEADAEMLIDYLKITCGETRYLIKEPEEITLTLEQEYEFINGNNNSEGNLLLLGFLDGEYVGNCSLMGKKLMRYKHRASVGIALFLKYTNLGIGRVMLEKLIAVAKEKGLEQLELEVAADNARAIHLYESLGFEICGTFPNNMKFKDGTYMDCHWMMKKL